MKGGSPASDNVMNAFSKELNFYPCDKSAVCNPVAGGGRVAKKSTKNLKRTMRRWIKKAIASQAKKSRVGKKGGKDPGLQYFTTRSYGDSAPGGTLPVPSSAEHTHNFINGVWTFQKTPGNITNNSVIDAMSMQPIINFDPFGKVYPAGIKENMTILK